MNFFAEQILTTDFEKIIVSKGDWVRAVGMDWGFGMVML